MVAHQHENMLVGSQAQELGAQHQVRGQIEWTLRLSHHSLIDLSCSTRFRNAGEVADFQCHRARCLHDLYWTGVRHLEYGTQNFMALD